MPGKRNETDNENWEGVIYMPDDEQAFETTLETPGKIFTETIALYLYNDLYRGVDVKRFADLDETTRSAWYEFVSVTPLKLSALELQIRPFDKFCRTCIITDNEIEQLALMDLSGYAGNESFLDRMFPGIGNDRPENPILTASGKKSDGKVSLFKELNYILLSQFRKTGYEIVRPRELNEIDIPMTGKLARALHSRYMRGIRSGEISLSGDSDTGGPGDPEKNGSAINAEFDDLPDDIKYSNLDNAYHIPTKLLSIGYKIRPLQKGFRAETLLLGDDEVEAMARVEHIRWSWDKRLNGWKYGLVKDSGNKTHPGLIPYEELEEQEKEKDRDLVRHIPALLQDIDYEAYPVNPDRIRKLSYAIKPQSSIYKVLRESRELSDQIRKIVSLPPEIEEIVKVRNAKIEEAIAEVEENYNYARHIQETFLPYDLYVRECFPESFVLFKPKDIVSGDFYFFSKTGGKVIFAAADCTGHGIPGALLSTIGYGILDQAVNELKLIDPADILRHLYSKVHRFLRHEIRGSGIPDDMDSLLCVYDPAEGTVSWTGVKNPFYLVRKGELTEYRPTGLPDDCGEENDCPFRTEAFRVNAGDTLYLFSDGFRDQFGGPNHKRYQSARFKSFLLDIQDFSMSEQSDRLYAEIEHWREERNEEQTDDILVIGIRI